jgi:hypothetical protein
VLSLGLNMNRNCSAGFVFNLIPVSQITCIVIENTQAGQYLCGICHQNKNVYPQEFYLPSNILHTISHKIIPIPYHFND